MAAPKAVIVTVSLDPPYAPVHPLCICRACVTPCAGLPLPVDSLHAFGQFLAVLPFDRYMMSNNDQAYEYDPVMQRTTHLGSVIEYFMPPMGESMTYVPGLVFANWSTSMLWINQGSCQGETTHTLEREPRKAEGRSSRQYALCVCVCVCVCPDHFNGMYYWRWHAPGEGISGQAVTSNGWDSSLSLLDSWCTSSLRWSHIFHGNTVHRYDNAADGIDTSGAGFPMPISQFITTPGFPSSVDEMDKHLGTEHWVVFKGSSIALWNPRTLQSVQG
jgi:hypothetical protein